MPRHSPAIAVPTSPAPMQGRAGGGEATRCHPSPHPAWLSPGGMLPSQPSLPTLDAGRGAETATPAGPHQHLVRLCPPSPWPVYLTACINTGNVVIFQKKSVRGCFARGAPSGKTGLMGMRGDTAGDTTRALSLLSILMMGGHKSPGEASEGRMKRRC